MKEKLLIITKYPGDYSSIIDSNYSKYEIIWLQLFPVVGTTNLIKKYPEIKVVRSVDYIKNEDHYRIAKEVTNISNNWWDLLGFNSFDEEWNIEGLKISQIFSYEMEQVLTKIMFQLLTINKTIKTFTPNELLFIEKKRKENYSNEILNGFSNFELSNFYKLNLNEIKVNKEYLSTSTIAPVSYNNSRILKGLKNPGMMLRKIKLNIKTSRLINGSIIISNVYRCMQLFVEEASKKHNIFVLKDNAYYSPTKVDQTLLLKNSFNELFFDSVSRKPFFFEILQPPAWA